MPPSPLRFVWWRIHFMAGGLLLLAAVAGLSSCEKPAAPAPKAPGVNLASKLNAAQAEVAALEEAALQDYRALEARRVRLATATPAEIEAFNRDAAHYKLTREALKVRQEELKMMAADEEASREAAARAGKPHGK
jgi:hypothetical protein